MCVRQTALAAIAEYSRHPSDEVLMTGVLNAEAIVFSRAFICTLLDDAHQEALTPNRILLHCFS